MKNKSQIVLTTVLCLVPMIAGVILYSRLPDSIATHFGVDGQPDGWSSKAFAVFGLPAIIAGLNLLMHFGLRTDPKRKNMSPALFNIAIWTVPAVSIPTNAFVLANALGYESRIEVILPLLVSLLFIVIGNYLPKTKQSYTMGIKLPWTLASEENWNRTHRLAGYLWVACGILMALLTLLKIGRLWLMPALIAVMVLVPTIYSYSLYKKGI